MYPVRTATITVLGVDVYIETDLGWLPNQSLFKMWETHLERRLRTRVIIVRTNGCSSWRVLDDSSVFVELDREAWNPEANAFFSIALFAAEICRQRHGLFQSHAAGFAYASSAVLLAGDSGAGKTVSTLRMCSEPGIMYSGGDRVQLCVSDGLFSLTGHWRNTRLRASSFRDVAAVRNVRRRLSSSVTEWADSSAPGWDVKMVASVSELGLNGLMGSLPIVAIYDVRVLASGGEVEVEDVGARDAVHALSASISPVTAGFLAVLSEDGNPVMNPFHDAFPFAYQRKVELMRSARTVPRVRIRGGLEPMVEYLISRHLCCSETSR